MPAFRPPCNSAGRSMAIWIMWSGRAISLLHQPDPSSADKAPAGVDLVGPVAFVVDRFKPVVEDCGRVQTVRPLSVENTAGIGVARSIFERRDAAERVEHVLCAGGLTPKVNRSARNTGLATDKEGPGWLLQGGSQVVQRNDRAAFIKCESDRVDPIRQEGAEADVGPVGRATAAFLGPAPRGPAALHERLREVYGLVVRDPLWLAIAADCIDERRLKCTELFKFAVLPTQ